MLALIMCAVSATAQAQEATFPRCKLDDTQRSSFMELYASGHLAVADGEFEQARKAFSRALKVCMDDEVIWFLARVNEQLGDVEKAARLDETWRTQRTLHNLSLDMPAAPNWSSVVPTPQGALIAAASISLDEPGSSKGASGTYPIPLPTVYRNADAVASVHVGRFPKASTLARLSVQIVPMADATLWLSDGTFLGVAPLEEVMIPARTDIVLVLKVNDKQMLVRTVRAEPGTHQRLFINVPEQER